MVIVPIIFKGKEEEIIQRCKEIKAMLEQKGFRVFLDDREITPGNKYYEWELKGVPLRIEVGPRDIEKKQITLALRGVERKVEIKAQEAGERIGSMLAHYAEKLFEEANRFNSAQTHQASTLEEVKGRKGLIKLPWCGKEECGKAIEETLDMNTLGTPLDEDPSCKNKEVCPICRKPAQTWVRFAKLY
jgi:prolyl-tRNA synthetase